MKLTGYGIQTALRNWKSQRDLLQALFSDSLKVFPDEKKEHPKELNWKIMAAEDAIAQLQNVQIVYNQKVHTGVEGCSLMLAIRMLGGFVRSEQRWKSEVVKKEDYGFRSDVRSADEVRSVPQMSTQEIGEELKKTSSKVTLFRQAIAEANATEVEFNDYEMPTELF